MFEGRENDESILNSDTGISSDLAHSLTLVFVFVFLILFSKRKPYLLIFLFKCYSYKNVYF